MNYQSDLSVLNLCGVYEFDRGGRIVYCGAHSSDGYFKPKAELIGNNFYDIAGFENIEDLRRRIKFFLQDSNPSEKFDFDCRFSESVSNVKVKLGASWSGNQKQTRRSSSLILEKFDRRFLNESEESFRQHYMQK